MSISCGEPEPHPSRRIRRALFSIGIVALATVIQYWVWPWIRPAPYLLFYPAALLTALYGNGLIGIPLSIAMAEYFFGAWEPHSLVRAAIFLTTAALISAMTQALASARALAQSAALDHLEARREIERSERRYRQLIEQVRDYAIFLLDPEGRISTWNEGARKLTGYQAHEIMTHEFKLLYPHEDQAPGIELSKAKHADIRQVRRKDGSVLWADILITPIFEEGGSLTGYTHVIRDITELKMEQDALCEALEKLETEQKLRDRFIATISHDLRGPLTAIKASAELLLRSSGQDEPKKRLAARIVTSVARADKMIGDLLDASQIRAGQRLPLQIEKFSLNDLIHGTLEELNLVHGNRIIASMDDSLVGYWSKEGLRRLLENLCINAVKYGSQSYPITVSAIRTIGGPVISVHNEGPCIPSDQQKTLFDPYSRHLGSQKKNTKGWGLGLTLVRGIAEALGGSVRVHSQEDDGTTFTVRIPWDSRPFQEQDIASEAG